MQAAALSQLEAQASEVAGVLGTLANDKRLLVLCELMQRGECNVGSLSEAVGLSQSALSQHLAKMRDEKIVTFRREAQTIWYRLADARIEQLLAALHDLYCRPKRKK